MKLIRALETVINEGDSFIQIHLAKEDLARVKKLCELAKTAQTPQEMEKDGLYIGWTQGDIRTHELADDLKPLIRAIYDFEKLDGPAEIDDRIMKYWANFHTNRLKTLVHCL